MLSNPVNCLEIDIPDAVMSECSRIENGQGLKLHGTCIKRSQGSAKVFNKTETVTIHATKKDTSVVFSLHSSSMGKVLQKKLSGIWSCQVQSTSSHASSPNIDPTIVKQEIGRATEEPSDAQKLRLSTNCVQSTDGLKLKAKEESDNAESSRDCCELAGTSDNPARTDRNDGDSSETGECSIMISSMTKMKNDHAGTPEPEIESSSDENDASRHSADVGAEGDGKHRDKPHACTKCNKRFISKFLLERHEPIHDPDVMMQCPICPRQYKLKFQFERHMKTHTGEPSTTTCAVCNKSLKSKSSLDIHMRLHTGEKPYTCETCGRCFSSNSRLLFHTRRHTGDKRYECGTCKKRFADSSTLTVHKRIHTGERPHMCIVCGKTFRDHSGIIVHMRFHTGEKPYKCSVCEKSFCNSSRLRDHEPSHNAERSFFCEVCGMAFWQRSHLSHHKRIHNEKKKYKCPTCGRDFRTNAHLKIHIRQHTGEKPYACVLCEKSFKQLTLLTRHKRLDHPMAS